MEGILKNVANTMPAVKTSGAESDKEYAKKIAQEISEVTRQLSDIEKAFNLVVEDELIESLIYEQSSLKAKLNYLVRLAKEKNISYSELYYSEK